MQKESKKTVSNTGIYVLDKEKDKVESKTETVFTILGQQDKLQGKLPVLTKGTPAKSQFAYAKKNTNGNKNTYFVKVDNNGHLYNPMAIDRQMTLKSKLLKDEVTKFIRVSEVCFNFYLEFLKSKNVLHLKSASRER